ncbi:PTS fructose transporter subunit IIABC [Mycoplasma sp. SG1]|uniref:PTS fructose transporter subunit IIABC n=1 Tax=Mycoplasma sp. SG1 TaxID=2810348 RepID=UPI002024FF8B|nr:fructose-specific PTS transporter subunit EIIC [Mycoplasma sp. SG1]URM53088.1 fructose-specific PTS transporter subunit EIIC [Mycoplasma sp. SG1]
MIYKDLILKGTYKSRSQLFEEVALLLKQKGFVTDEKKLVDELMQRENEGSTNFNEGIAIPHARSKNILKTSVVIVNCVNDIEWNSQDENKVKVAIFLIVADSSTQLHLPILARISSKLLDDDFKQNLFKFNKAKILKMLKEIEKEVQNSVSEKSNLNTKQEINVKQNLSSKDDDLKPQFPQKFEAVPDDKKLFIVGVSSCPVGIAHTHMVATALERAAKSFGYDVKIEKQAAEGIVNGLTSEDIMRADLVIIAAGKTIPMDRFVGKRVYEARLGEVLKKPKEIVKDAVETARVYEQEGAPKNGKAGYFERRKQKSKSGIMGYLMYGVGWMIPIVITGGILLAISSPFVSDLPKDYGFGLHLLKLLNDLGGLAFQLMIPVLGGFIAYAIADKIAFAPAAIISFLGNQLNGDNMNEFLFNWPGLSFGLKGGALGYLGAIAIGLFIGYLCLWMKKWKWPNVLLPLVPICFVPIIASLVGWVAIAFILALPVYYIQTGLHDLVTLLQKHSLLLLMGLVLGAMIAIDMGGPINKIAFFLGVDGIGTNAPNKGVIMGMDASAIAVPPIAAFITWVILRKKMDDDDSVAGKAALGLGFMGITEGAIPFAVKYPKFIIANVVGGMVAGAFSGVFAITDLAGHGGMIVYLLGAIGKNGQTNFLYGLLHIVSILLGACVTSVLSVLFFTLDLKRNKVKKESSIGSPLSYSMESQATRL